MVSHLAAAGYRKMHRGKAKSSMKRKYKGFTLMELLVVIAIIAVLVAIAIPMLASQLKKSREATDLANVRSAYAQVSAAAILGDTTATAAVDLKQRTADWQSVDPVNIGGIVHSEGQPDTNNWIGTATPGGSCVVSYSESYGVVLTWNGTAAPGKPSYPFNTAYTNFFDDVLYKTAFWNDGTLSNNALFEFDSLCPNSTYIPQIKAELDKQTNSLLQRENCTWAFLGFKKKTEAEQEKNSYLFWTSLDTNKIGAGKQIPVLIQTGDGKYYVSETTTGQRTDSKGKKYVAASEHLKTADAFQEILNKSVNVYPTLEAAYDAYVVALADHKYDAVRATQTSAS